MRHRKAEKTSESQSHYKWHCLRWDCKTHRTPNSLWSFHRDLNTYFKLQLWVSELVVKMRWFRMTDINWSQCHSLLLLQWKYSMLMGAALKGTRWLNGKGTIPEFAGLTLFFTVIPHMTTLLNGTVHAKLSGRCPRCAKKQHNFQFTSFQNDCNFQRC